MILLLTHMGSSHQQYHVTSEGNQKMWAFRVTSEYLCIRKSSIKEKKSHSPPSFEKKKNCAKVWKKITLSVVCLCMCVLVMHLSIALENAKMLFPQLLFSNMSLLSLSVLPCSVDWVLGNHCFKYNHQFHTLKHAHRFVYHINKHVWIHLHIL